MNERAEAERRVTQTSRARINTALLGGSCKRLYTHSLDSDGPPAAVQSPDDPSTLLTDPHQVKEATVRYFASLFSRTLRSPSQKPWMATPTITRIREQTAANPFIWPKFLTLADLRALLRKGNPRPSPPPISGRNGITCSNLIKNLPFAWLNQLLAPYVAQHGILPETQVATQPGVQARDLVSFLAQVDAYAHRRKQPLFVLRRDQRKGFDRLEPQGFYDAVRAYGLPDALIELDRSAQDQVPYQVKTAYGLTAPFTVSGVTQQGGPFSPLKSTLTTSMVNHWLHDVLAPEDCLTFMSHQGALGKPHTPDDRLCLRVQMVEAMDDSILLMPTLASLQSAALHADRFQATYGWETNWSKSLLYVTQSHAAPATATMPAVNPTDPDSPNVTFHPVPVTTDFFDFLRVQVNDPDAQRDKIRHLISTFSFPHLPTRLPLTALRRILSSCLISQLRPYLSYQPIARTSALNLDHLIAHHVHEYLGFPFHFHSQLLFAPLSHLGFDFRSLSHLNDAAAIQGLLRDLNSHVPTFRTMARITLADWTCMLNKCRSPLE
ncbi:hypothetical protein OH77DRAFT_1410697, partial [Trametes cingulata]